MSNPYGYPFLRIARKYELNYGDVLHYAHNVEHAIKDGPDPET
jgi:hypothetical protein